VRHFWRRLVVPFDDVERYPCAKGLPAAWEDEEGLRGIDIFVGNALAKMEAEGEPVVWEMKRLLDFRIVRGEQGIMVKFGLVGWV
jgi:hypothetical protein